MVITLYNGRGQLLSTLVDTRQEAGEHLLPIDRSRFAKGLHIVHFRTAGLNCSMRLPF